jgi:hypothetical protein
LRSQIAAEALSIIAPLSLPMMNLPALPAFVDTWCMPRSTHSACNWRTF